MLTHHTGLEFWTIMKALAFGSVIGLLVTLGLEVNGLSMNWFDRVGLAGFIAGVALPPLSIFVALQRKENLS